ncbi:MAG: signal recognition particle-docking protein FtsY [Polyangiaceae bacterium]|nr:signal recognition particle-docking protein FtsY [Polyangiaceae bacterium]
MHASWIALIAVVILIALAVHVLFLRKLLGGKKESPELPAKQAEEKEIAPAPPAPEKKAPPELEAPELKAELKAKGAVAEEPGAADVSLVNVPAPIAAPPPPVISKKEVAGLRKGLAATRGGFMAKLKAIFTGKKEIDPAILTQMEEVMISSDVGVKTTQAILARVRDGMAKNELTDSDAVWASLRAEATRILTISAPRAPKGTPHVILMVGVNGVGKTTTIGKLATKWNADGKKILLAAGDTFRAAAVQQLEVWGRRVGVDVVKGKEGADPGSVAFEATKKAQESNADVLLVDTAGRLHTKVNLMDEIKKVKRTIAKAMDGAPHETLLVLDATTGQNALTQAALFKEALELTGIILTKLDGTAKGGIVLGVCDELKVPVRYVGLGERAEDLREFVAADFVEALFGKDDDESEAA